MTVRPPRTFSRSSTKNYGSSLPCAWPAKPRATPLTPLPWFTKPTSGWWATSNSTAAGISSLPQPPQCGEFSSNCARKKLRRKHGGDRRRQEWNPELIAAPVPDDELLALDAALARLSERDPVKSRLVELRYFAGLTGDQAAEILGVSAKTVDRYWVYARAWLRREMEGGDTEQKKMKNR